MKSLRSFNATNHAQLPDYSVVDQKGESLGTVHSFWTYSDSEHLEFLGIKTGWLFGSNHVVPADKAEFDQSRRIIQVPYLLAKVKDAPAMGADTTVSDEQKAEIYRYYGLTQGPRTATVADPTDDASISQAGASAETSAR